MAANRTALIAEPERQGTINESGFFKNFFNKITSLLYYSKFELIENLAAEYSLQGQPDKVCELISQNLDILLYTVKATGPNGIPFIGTLYQLSLWMDDNYIKNAEGETFTKMLRRHLITHHGEKEEIRQRQMQFPPGWERLHKAQLKADKAAFDMVCKAFDESKASSPDALAADTILNDAIVKFKKQLEPKGIITSGKERMVRLWEFHTLNIKSLQAVPDTTPPIWRASQPLPYLSPLIVHEKMSAKSNQPIDQETKRESPTPRKC